VWIGNYESGWALATPIRRKRERNGWEAAHRYVRGAARRADVSAEAVGIYAEPDWLQTYAEYASAYNSTISDIDFDTHYPHAAALGFHLTDGELGKPYTQLSSARSAAGNGAGVRIAILDTGYDPKQVCKPLHLDPSKIGRDFFRDPNGAPCPVDPCDVGFLLFPGHGHACLSATNNSSDNKLYFGNGTLRAYAALDASLAQSILGRLENGTLRKMSPDIVSHPLLRILLGLGEPSTDTPLERMYLAEMEHICMRSAKRSPYLHTLFVDDLAGTPSVSEQKAILDRFIASVWISTTLRSHLTERRGKLH
jgi:hypothetical protein